MEKRKNILSSGRLIAVTAGIILSAVGSLSAATLPDVPVQPSHPITPPTINLPSIEINFDYTVADGKATITKYKGTSPNVVIPTKMGGYPVTAIGLGAFAGNKTITTVVIPEGVTELKDYAFSSCTKLSSITLPSTLKAIKEEAFYYCSSLRTINLPASLEEIGLWAFKQTNLSTITIPKKTTVIAGSAFDFCQNLAAINVESGNTGYCSIDGILYDAAKTTLIKYPQKNTATTLTIPNTVKNINTSAVQLQEYLQTVTIPSSVTYISSTAFAQCTNLTTVTFQGTSLYMGGAVFSHCPNLTNVTLPSELKSIPEYTFEGCASLKSVTIPDTVTTIGKWSFMDCSNLAQVKLPKNLTKIESAAFYKCIALQSISLPDTLTEIQAGVFAYCTNLTSVTFPSSIAKINIKAFAECSNLKDVRFLGDAPKLGDKVFLNAAAGFKVYYPSNGKNWSTPTWYGYPSQPYSNSSALPVVPLRPPLLTPINKNIGAPIDPSQLTPPTLPFDIKDETVKDLAPELSLVTPAPQGVSEIKLYLGKSNYLVGSQQLTMDTSPILKDGRLLLPVRYIADPLGAETSWDGAEQKVTITLKETVIELWINNPIAKVNGVEKQIDPNNPNVKPIVVPPGRTMLPLRFIGENLGCDISWDSSLQEAKLTFKK